MANFVAQLRALGLWRLGALAGTALMVLGLIVWFAIRASQPVMGLLYADLAQRDAGQVIAALDRLRIPYRVEGNGSRIMVADDQVGRVRLSLAREGLPAGGNVGYEIFDRNESLTTTPFQQDMNRVRAMEGELARSIASLSGVRAARVHLVMPRREAFSRERGDAQASVMLTMQGAHRLDREAIQAVLHLVSTAVPGLRPQNISIVDSRGALLARGGQALAGPSAAASQDEVRRTQELRLARAVEEMLERSLGPGRVRAEASVDMDFDRVQVTEERFDPDNQVARSQQSVQETSRGSEGAPTSVQNNLPGNENTGAGNQESRQEETTNFEIGRTTRSTTRDQPSVRRISIGVLVDGVWEPQANGPPQYRDRSAEELARIATLVRTSVGFDERRGDKVEVVAMRFAEPPLPTESNERSFFDIAFTSSTVARIVESALFALVALIAILLLGRPAVKRLVTLAKPAQANGQIGSAAANTMTGGALAAGGAALAGPQGGAGLPMVQGGAASAEPESMISLAMVQGQMRASSINRLQELVDSNPEQSLNVIRRWIAPSEEVV
ncbi:MAG: flagellar M-ring protein FliF [Pseudomonadota bacterium]|jgi:flagellar M-ring protein FliF|nr:flagellar M-ring protein FliF [Acetobacteraceae bacterium]NBS42944.1 flagellar M-ring protein FliF [Acetobacteraceae bacterium]